MRDKAMPLSESIMIRSRSANGCAAHAVTAELMSDIVVGGGRRFPSIGQSEKPRGSKPDRFGSLDDAALALIDLELPPVQVRRIAY